MVRMKLTTGEKVLIPVFVTTVVVLCVVFIAIYPRAPPEEGPPTDTTPPAQVTGLAVTDAYNGKLDLSWDSCTDPDFDHYNIYRDEVTITETTDDNYRDTGLTNDQSYDYQVSAVDNSGNEGQKSSTASGTPTATESTPPTISNLQPAEDSTIGDNTPTMGASYSDPSGVDTTSVKISVDSKDVTSSATVTSTSVTYTPTTALTEEQHTVEVRVSDNYGNEATQTWSFTIFINELPSIPKLSIPQNGSTVTENTPTFGWGQSTDPDGNPITYQIQIDDDSGFSSPAEDVSGLSDNSYTPSTGLPNDTYYWRVRAVDNNGGQSDWSETWSVTVAVDYEERWALLLCSANDFPENTSSSKVYDTVPNYSFETGSTSPDYWDNIEITPVVEFTWDSTTSHSGGRSVKIEHNSVGWGIWQLIEPYWIDVTPEIEYYASVWVKTADMGKGYIGLAWYDEMYAFIWEDWSPGVSSADWTLETITATSPANARYLQIKLSNTTGFPEGSGAVWFDDVSVWHYTHNAALTDKDGFPAQVLQAYYILKSHGYDDDHITLMLYHTNDSVIDIEGDGTNDLTNATIDVEDDAVTKSRFQTEMQNLANTANANDEVLVYMVDHGSQDVTEHFHFETGGSISEAEVDTLLDGFTCERMTVLVDSCYSGGFISSLGGANRILVSATSAEGGLNTAKYWAEANPPAVSYAGSWFFHPFWERIDAEDSIQSALTYAIGTIPTITGPYAGLMVETIQDPDLVDGVGDAGTYTFV